MVRRLPAPSALPAPRVPSPTLAPAAIPGPSGLCGDRAPHPPPHGISSMLFPTPPLPGQWGRTARNPSFVFQAFCNFPGSGSDPRGAGAAGLTSTCCWRPGWGRWQFPLQPFQEPKAGWWPGRAGPRSCTGRGGGQPRQPGCWLEGGEQRAGTRRARRPLPHPSSWMNPLLGFQTSRPPGVHPPARGPPFLPRCLCSPGH